MITSSYQVEHIHTICDKLNSEVKQMSTLKKKLINQIHHKVKAENKQEQMN